MRSRITRWLREPTSDECILALLLLVASATLVVVGIVAVVLLVLR